MGDAAPVRAASSHQRSLPAWRPSTGLLWSLTSMMILPCRPPPQRRSKLQDGRIGRPPQGDCGLPPGADLGDGAVAGGHSASAISLRSITRSAPVAKSLILIL